MTNISDLIALNNINNSITCNTMSLKWFWTWKFLSQMINILFNITNNILILILLININPYITIKQKQNAQESSKSIKCNRILWIW